MYHLFYSDLRIYSNLPQTNLGSIDYVLLSPSFRVANAVTLALLNYAEFDTIQSNNDLPVGVALISELLS